MRFLRSASAADEQVEANDSGPGAENAILAPF